MALIAAHGRPDLFSAAVVESGFTEFGYEARIINRDPAQAKPRVVLIHGVLDPDICIDCRPGVRCAVTGRQCGSIYGADGLNELLDEASWGDDELLYLRLEGVTHRWQPQLNTTWWRWLAERPNPAYPQRPAPVQPFMWPALPTSSSADEAERPLPRVPMTNLEGMTQFAAGSFEMGNPLEDPQPYGDGWFIDQTPLFIAPVGAVWVDQREVTVA